MVDGSGRNVKGSELDDNVCVLGLVRGGRGGGERRGLMWWVYVCVLKVCGAVKAKEAMETVRKEKICKAFCLYR